MATLLQRFRSLIVRQTRKLVPSHRPVRARWDAVQTTDENARHWGNADGLSARFAASPQVRRIFRNRSRYEYANNSYCQGIVLSLANHTIGTGPRLQVLTPNRETNRIIEQKFAGWMRRRRIAEKLRTAWTARNVDGETFLFKVTNEGKRDLVSLDVQLVEADQIATPTMVPWQLNWVDGIEFDSWGNPKTYHKLKYHPGDQIAVGTPLDYESVPAESVIHLFRVDRPGQVRGIPPIAPALPLFALLRRFTLATIGAAETAADFAAVLYTDSTPDNQAEQLPEDQWFDAIPMEYRAMLTLPSGWKMNQFRAEHPSTTYEMFKRAVLQEIARCLSMPYNIAAGDSSSYNYASGRLDHQTYYRAIEIDQHGLEEQVLDDLFLSWLVEASLIPDYLPEELGILADLPHQWFWDAVADIDPEKTANAERVGIVEAGTLSRHRALAQKGIDIDDEDQKAAESYGKTVQEYREALFDKHFKANLPALPAPSNAPSGDSQDSQEPAHDGQDDENPSLS